MAKKKATSSDVAARAGVSQATVSMVLNRKYNVSFSRETVERVEQAARELGYELPGRRKHKDNRKETIIPSAKCKEIKRYSLQIDKYNIL